MPELPEVETVRRGLAPVLEGQVIARVIQRRADLRFPFPDHFARRLEGARITHLGRRAKYMLWHLDSGEVVIVHLGMSGRFTILAGSKSNTSSAEGPDGPNGSGKHDHLVIETKAGTRVIYTDHRRFGFMVMTDEESWNSHAFFADMGPEPLGNELNADHLSSVLKPKRTPIKAALLDQRVIAGLGNIYVCEALWRAKVSPKRLARSVAGVRAARLVPAIRDIITEAIEAGGSTLRDFAHTDGELGYFQKRFDVYDREGAPCSRGDGGVIRRITQSGRSTYYCPVCQR